MEGELKIDEGATERVMSIDSPFVPTVEIAEREGEECVERALEKVGGDVKVGTEPLCVEDDEGKETFADVVGNGRRDEGA